ncbi:hypothetical protein [Cellulomonas wangsupingiae]|uniref:hypothetical protein n=1 Tax=Cellulomonas wangsupingiae TaxID=2968085 RepID=UPI001D0DC952|nr:hypothetical protein [Cellulomonas wangsupingiae]MCM0638439.1 hypothetical protein [Cellulomonas wangsupingiae]
MTTTSAPTPPQAPGAPGPSEPAPPSPGWWRRNRWALVALPVVLALALAASGDRVRTLWWQHDLRVPATAGADGTVAFRQRVADGGGGTLPIDVRVRLEDVSDATSLPEDMELPPGTRAVQVDLALEADPDVVLLLCRLAVRDAQGTRYEYVANAWGASQAFAPCVPADAPGPWPPMGDLDEALSDPEAPARPRTWSTSPVVVVPQDVEVADVVLWWQMPQHLVLEVPA